MMDPSERSKELRDEKRYYNPFQPFDEPKVKPLPRSYYYTPADEDYAYKALALAPKFLATAATIGLYDAYMHKGYKTVVPMVAHSSTFLMPGVTAMICFIGANAIAVKIRGEENSWCHFWGPFATVAFISHYYKLGITYPLAPLMGLIGVRYRFMRHREIETGKPIHFKYDSVGDGLGTQPVPSMFSLLCRMKPVYSWPSDTPDI